MYLLGPALYEKGGYGYLIPQCGVFFSCFRKKVCNVCTTTRKIGTFSSWPAFGRPNNSWYKNYNKNVWCTNHKKNCYEICCQQSAPESLILRSEKILVYSKTKMDLPIFQASVQKPMMARSKIKSTTFQKFAPMSLEFFCKYENLLKYYWNI